ncbi:MAG: ABC transporter permease subunit [Thermoprotei archaeon]
MNTILIITLAVLATTARVFGLVGLSILSGWGLGYLAIKSRVFENVYVSVIEVLESVPVISFFPVILIFFIERIGGPLGVELAADFLVFTAVVWNIWMGIYQAFKTLPNEILEVSQNYRLGFLERMRNIYIPFSLPRISANLFPSLADGFFYITVSEVISVGTTEYSTFGVGSILQHLTSMNELNYVYIAMLVMGLVIIGVTLGVREFATYAVSKYTLDTDTPITRRGRPRLRYTVRLSALISRSTIQRLSSYTRRQILGSVRLRRGQVEEARHTVGHLGWKLLSRLIGILILALLVWGIIATVVSVPASAWVYYLASTPTIVLSMLYDYLRVGIIALVSLGITVTLGYVLAVNHKAEGVCVPLIQVLFSYPAPLYFPLLFVFTLPIVENVFGPFSAEFYVIVLGFISTFYYVFFSFWMGVKSIPHEYWEVMRNMGMGFAQRMRYIIMPATFPYIIAGISSTINSAWGGLMLGEYWPGIYGAHTLTVRHGLMKLLDVSTATGNLGLAAWASLLFGFVVAAYSILFTRRMLDLARKRYVVEEGIYAA